MPLKLFVTVGSMYPLDRLSRQADTLGCDPGYDVFAQIGRTDFKPQFIRFTPFLNHSVFRARLEWADIVLSHAGAGNLIELLRCCKRFLLFPRLKRYGEAIDDHQLELCRAFAASHGVIWTTNPAEIAELLPDLPILQCHSNPKLIGEIRALLP